MKFRKGYVSNSSSSSFVVAFEREINSKEDLIEIEDFEYYDEVVPQDQARQMIFWQLENQKPFSTVYRLSAEKYAMYSYEEALEKYEAMYGMSVYDDEDENREAYFDNIRMDLYEKAKKEFNKKYDNGKMKYLYMLNFSDNDGGYNSAMEHGDVFKNIPHTIESLH